MHRTFVELLERNADHAAEFQDRFDGLQESQRPVAVTVSCSDSRVLADHLWGIDEPGRLFSVANIGNRVVQRVDEGEVVSGDVLYPVEHTGTELVVVVGHTGCGAVTAAYDDLTTGRSEPPGIDHCIGLVASAIEAGVVALPADVDREGAVNRLVEYNVDRQVEFLRASDDVPDHAEIVGVVYDFQDVYSDRRGAVHVVNVGGETAVDTLRAEHPEIASRVQRLWEY